MHVSNGYLAAMISYLAAVLFSSALGYRVGSRRTQKRAYRDGRRSAWIDAVKLYRRPAR